MQDDFSQDSKPLTNKSQNSSSGNDESLDWAKEAYLKLKQKQKEKKELIQEELKKEEIFNDKQVDIISESKIKEDLKNNIWKLNCYLEL